MSRVEFRKKGRRHQKANLQIAPRALIADDDPEAAQLLQLVMINFGFETTLAFDGKNALEQISNKPFDLIFLDICMPELTGPQVLSKIEDAKNRRLRKCKGGTNLPIITYSSYDRDDLKIPEERGFYIVGHWQKPITLPELTTLTGQTVNQLGISLPTSPTPILKKEENYE